ncbi:MAG: hypothetical protein WDN06_01345 [Asticcacaulis sp.]
MRNCYLGVSAIIAGILMASSNAYSQSVEDLDQQAKAAYVANDFSKAAELYQRAADQGDAEAQSRSLGTMYYKGEGIPKDPAKAAQLLQKAADQGIAEAQSNLGAMYY